MNDEKKPDQTPREIIAKLAAMSPEKFNQFMGRLFDSLCRQPLTPAEHHGGENGQE